MFQKLLELLGKLVPAPKESINHHFVLIEAPEEIVGPEIILWGEASWWPTASSMRFIKVTHGKLSVGTEFEQRVVPRGPRWNARVTRMIPNREVERTFLNGMFQGGYEVVKLESRYNGTKVLYTMHYQVKGLINKFMWSLLFQRLHDRNIEMILNALKKYALKKVEESKESREP